MRFQLPPKPESLNHIPIPYYRPLEVCNPIGGWRDAELLAPVTMNGSGFSGGLYYVNSFSVKLIDGKLSDL